MKTFLIFALLIISDGLVSAAIQTTLSQDKPARLYIKNYTMANDGKFIQYECDEGYFYYGGPWTNVTTDTLTYNGRIDWQEGVPGGASWQSHDDHTGVFEWLWTGEPDYNSNNADSDAVWAWPAESWPYASCTLTEIFLESDQPGNCYTNTFLGYSAGDIIRAEHCDINASYHGTISDYLHILLETIESDRRTADAEMNLQTGGKAIPGQRTLFYLKASASHLSPENAIEASSYISGYHYISEHQFGTNVPEQDIQVGTYGTPNSQGVLYLLLKNGDDVDITPRVKNVDYYSLNLQPQAVKTKADWQKVVQYEIDNDSNVKIENYLAGNGFMTNRANIQAVYAFYQKLFVERPEQFYWAGLGKLAGAPVYAGLSDAQQVSTFLTNLVILNELETNGDAEVALALETNGVPFIQTFQQNLIQMNIDILSDLAWQFEAYKNGGLAAIQTAYAYGNSDLDPFATNAWGEVGQGTQTSDAASIQDGNKKLLQREQQQILAGSYSKLTAMSNSVTWAMSEFAKNPVPGGPDFISMEPSGNIANYLDRWDWITHPYVSPSNTGMWPLWIGTPVNTQLSWVKVPLTTYATNYAIILPLIQ